LGVGAGLAGDKENFTFERFFPGPRADVGTLSAWSLFPLFSNEAAWSATDCFA
jgi:hypothetical protein